MNCATNFPLLLFLLLLVCCAVVAPAPESVEAVYLDGIGIVTCWNPVAGSSGYQVSVTSEGSPDWSLFDVKTPAFHFKETLPNRTYVIQVRQRTAKAKEKFSPKVVVESVIPGSDNLTSSQVNDLQFYMNVNGTAILTWPSTPKQLIAPTGNETESTLLSCLSFSVEVCRREKVFRRWTTNETLVSDVVVKNVFNETTNTTSTLFYKNYTIHYVKEHEAFVRFRNVSCDVITSNELRFGVPDLQVGQNYSYIVRLYLGSTLVGKYAEGNFTATPYIPPPPVVVETIFTGVVVYGISCGILIVALLVSFVFAWVCKWERFISDVHIKKAKYAEEKREAKARLLQKKQQQRAKSPPPVKYMGKEGVGSKASPVLL